MGKKHKELTSDDQLNLIIETTELASIYQKDPDEDTLKGGNPIGKGIKDFRKEKKKKKKKKLKANNGLSMFTAPKQGSWVEDNEDLYDTKAGKEMNRVLERAANSLKETKEIEEPEYEGNDCRFMREYSPYYQDSNSEELADRITNALFEDSNESVPVMVDPNTVALVSLNLMTSNVEIRNLDGEVVMDVKSYLNANTLVELLKEVITMVFNSEPLEENRTPVVETSVPEPEPMKEEEAEIPIVRTVPEEPEEEETFEMDEEDEPSKPLTQKLPIPSGILNTTTETKTPKEDISNRVAAMMETDTVKNPKTSPAGKSKFIIETVIPENR